MRFKRIIKESKDAVQQKTDKRQQNQEVEAFFRIVKEQITYKPVREEACRELEAHIEDKTEEYIHLGMSEEKAAVQAVKEMGDAASVGVLLNESYCLQMDYRLIGFILLGVLSGIAANLAYGYTIFDSGYCFLGLAVLYAVTVYGYRFCVLHTKKLSVVAILIALFLGVYGLASASMGGYFYQSVWEVCKYVEMVIHRFILPHTFFYNGMLLLVPLCAILHYKEKNKKWSGVMEAAIIIVVAVAGVTTHPWKQYMLTANVIVLTSYFVLAIITIGKKKELIVPILAVGLCTGLLFGATGEGSVSENLKQCFKPEVQAASRWEDAYNSVLIKELLDRAEFAGEIELTQEELVEYGVGTWYFHDEKGNKLITDHNYEYYYGDESYYEKMEDILPSAYQNNYRIAYTILKYGWGMGIVFLAVLAGLIGLLFYTTFRIKNKLGFYMAFGSSMVLSLQILLYTAGNFGYQFGMFTTLPFVSEGKLSSIVNMTLAGLVLSAYRYDRVTNEEEIGQRGRRFKEA